jgi:hypothetical protein
MTDSQANTQARLTVSLATRHLIGRSCQLGINISPITQTQHSIGEMIAADGSNSYRDLVGISDG